MFCRAWGLAELQQSEQPCVLDPPQKSMNRGSYENT